MRRIRIGVIGGGPACDWAVLPALSGPDVSAPPDTGVWWGRRAAVATDIAYQPPARVELVALADDDVARLYRTAAAWRIRAPYQDWRAMLREVRLDAIVAAPPASSAGEGTIARAGLIEAAADADLPLWLLDVPATSAREAEALAGFPNLWCARPLRSATAHRTARRIIESGRIGAISALALRWPRALCLDANASASAFAATYGAFDLLLWAASLPPRDSGLITPQAARIALDENGGAASLWIRFTHGFEGRSLAATALFAAADDWNTLAPRLEFTGQQGKAVVCEGGRRTSLLEPREAARTLEVPGLVPHLSHSNTLGIAEDLKAWLAHLAGGDAAISANSDLNGGATAGKSAEHSAANAGAALRLMEAAREALAGGGMVETDLRRNAAPQELETRILPQEVRAPVRPSLSTLRLPLDGP